MVDSLTASFAIVRILIAHAPSQYLFLAHDELKPHLAPATRGCWTLSWDYLGTSLLATRYRSGKISAISKFLDVTFTMNELLIVFSVVCLYSGKGITKRQSSRCSLEAPVMALLTGWQLHVSSSVEGFLTLRWAAAYSGERGSTLLHVRRESHPPDPAS